MGLAAKPSSHEGERMLDPLALSIDSTADELTGSAVPHRKAADLTPVSEIMAREVISVRPELGVEALETLFQERRITGAPVVDQTGNPLGVVSKTDLLAHRGVSSADSARVGDIMTPTTFFLSENESIAKAAGLMAFEGVHRVPVLGPRGQVVGMVSPLDVMRWLAREYGYTIGNRR
jgi:predicted transcriptional regulator